MLGNTSVRYSLLSSLGSSVLTASAKSIGLEVYNEKKDVAAAAANAKLDDLLEKAGSSPILLSELLNDALRGRIVPGVAKVMVRSMEEGLPISPAQFTDTLLILREAGLFEESLFMLQLAQSQGYSVSVNALCSMIRFGDSLRSTKQILRRIEEIGYELHPQLFYEAMTVVSRSGNHRDALELLEYMYFLGIDPTPNTYDLTLKILSWGTDDAGMVLNYLRELELFRGVDVTPQCYMTVILACSRLDKWEQVPILLDEMIAKKKEISDVVFISLVDSSRTRILSLPATLTTTAREKEVHTILTRLYDLFAKYIPEMVVITRRPFIVLMELASLVQSHTTVINVGKLMKTLEIDADNKQARRLLSDACEALSDTKSALYFAENLGEYFADEYYLNRTMILCQAKKDHIGAVQTFLQLVDFTSKMKSKKWSFFQEKMLVSDAINAFAVDYPTFLLPTSFLPQNNSGITQHVHNLAEALLLFKEGDLSLSENGVKVAVKILIQLKHYRCARRILRHALTTSRHSMNITNIYESAVDYLSSNLTLPTAYITSKSEDLFKVVENDTDMTVTITATSNFTRQQHMAADVLPLYLTPLIRDLCAVQEFSNAQMVFVKGIMRFRGEFGFLAYRIETCHKMRRKPRRLYPKGGAVLFRPHLHFVIDELPFQFYFSNVQAAFGSIPLPIQAYRIAALAFLEAELPEYSLQLFDFYIKQLPPNSKRDVVLERIVTYTLARSEEYYPQAHAMVAHHVQENTNINQDPFLLYCGIIACQHGKPPQYEQALTYLKRIGSSHHRLTSDHMHAVITVFTSSPNKAEEALQLLQTMTKFNIPIATVTYAEVILALARERKWREVAMIIQQIKNKIKMPRLPEAVAFFSVPNNNDQGNKAKLSEFLLNANIATEDELFGLGYKGSAREEKDRLKEEEKLKKKEAKAKKGFGGGSSSSGGGGFGSKSISPSSSTSDNNNNANNKKNPIQPQSSSASSSSSTNIAMGLPQISAPEVTAYDYLFAKPKVSQSQSSSEEQSKILAEWEREILKVCTRHPITEEQTNMYWWLLDELEADVLEGKYGEDWNGAEIFEQILICNSLMNAQDLMYRSHILGHVDPNLIVELKDMFQNLRMIQRFLGGSKLALAKAIGDSLEEIDYVWASDFQALNIDGVNLKSASIAMMKQALLEFT